MADHDWEPSGGLHCRLRWCRTPRDGGAGAGAGAEALGSGAEALGSRAVGAEALGSRVVSVTLSSAAADIGKQCGEGMQPACCTRTSYSSYLTWNLTYI
eukprot:COSAG01_NODE_15366_length_1343_cov_1.190858_3_plen_98_part_01